MGALPSCWESVLGAAVGGPIQPHRPFREEAPWVRSEIGPPLGSLKGGFCAVLNGPAVPERGSTATFLE